MSEISQIFTPQTSEENWSNGTSNPQYPEGILPFRYIGDVIHRSAVIKEITKRFETIKKLNPDYLVYDAGHGQGYLSEALAFNGVNTIGVEADKDMFDQSITRKKLLEIRADFQNLTQKLDYHFANIDNSPLPNNSVNEIVECGVAIFNDAPTMDRIMSDYSRVLKVGGLISINTYNENCLCDGSPTLIKTPESDRSAAKVIDMIPGISINYLGLGLSTAFRAYYYHSLKSPKQIREEGVANINLHSRELLENLGKKYGLNLIEVTDLNVEQKDIDISKNWQFGAIGYPLYTRYVFTK
jgi:SAM-dependent methyltransferase